MPVDLTKAVLVEKDSSYSKIYSIPCITGCGRLTRMNKAYAKVASGKCRHCTQLNTDFIATIFYELQKESIRRGLQVSLTLDEFRLLTKEDACAYCGQAILWKRRAYNLDRKDPKLGYTLDNVVVCCKECNRIKATTYSYDEMLRIGSLIRTFSPKQKFSPKCGRLGAKWISKGTKGKQIPATEVPDYLAEGWVVGRPRSHIY